MAPIVVTGRDERVTSRHKQHAQDKLSKLGKYFDGIQRIEAVLGHDSHGAEAELVISIRSGKPLVCHSKGKELYAAVDTVLDKAEKQLTRHKEKLKGHKGGGRAVPPSLEPTESAADGEEEGYQDIVEKRDFS